MTANCSINEIPSPYIWEEDKFPINKNPINDTIAIPPHFIYDGTISSATLEMAAATNNSLDAGQPSDKSSRTQKKAQTWRAREGVKQKWSTDWYENTYHWWRIFQPATQLAYHPMNTFNLELWRKYVTAAFGQAFRKYMKNAYNSEVMRRFNKSNTGLTLNNQVPQNVNDVEVIYFGPDFQYMVRSGNEGRTMVF